MAAGAATLDLLDEDAYLRLEALGERLEQGLQQGLKRGQVQTLRKLLGLRFGELDEATLTRLESADAASLDRYAERILTASSVDELFECPTCRGDLARSTEAFECTACKRAFPIREGIADFRL
jgi:hypothetical protein